MHIIQLPKGYNHVGEIFDSLEFKNFCNKHPQEYNRINIKDSSGKIVALVGKTIGAGYLERFCLYKNLTHMEWYNLN